MRYNKPQPQPQNYLKVIIMETPFSAEFSQILKINVEDAMRRFHIPGVAVGLMYGDQVWMQGFGVTSVENPLPVDENTLFQVGSVSKTFTALAVMRLVEQGRVDLDAPVRAYLPGLRLADESVAQRVTLRHIFTHTPGWLGDYFDDTGAGDDALERMVAHLVELPQETPLGEVFSYNNAGFYVAGRVLEVLCEQTYEQAVRDLVLAPLGLQEQAFFSPADVMTYRFVVGHDAVFPQETRPPKVQRPWALARCGNPVGGLTASVHALLEYARFQMGGGLTSSGDRLLSAERLLEMHAPRVSAANGEWLGVSWFSRQETRRDGSQVRIIRHGGATNGQMVTFQFAPAQGFAWTILTNSDRGDECYKLVSNWLLENLLDVVIAQPQARPGGEAEMAEKAGVYDATANRIVLTVDGPYFKIQSLPKGGFPAKDSPPPPVPPPGKAGLVEQDRLMILDEPGKGDMGEFLRGADGSITWLRISGRVHRKIA